MKLKNIFNTYEYRQDLKFFIAGLTWRIAYYQMKSKNRAAANKDWASFKHSTP